VRCSLTARLGVSALDSSVVLGIQMSSGSKESVDVLKNHLANSRGNLLIGFGRSQFTQRFSLLFFDREVGR